VCNDKGELLSFCLTLVNVDDRDTKTLQTLIINLFGKLFGNMRIVSCFLILETVPIWHKQYNKCTRRAAVICQHIGDGLLNRAAIDLVVKVDLRLNQA
jgi:hypothetical protein